MAHAGSFHCDGEASLSAAAAAAAVRGSFLLWRIIEFFVGDPLGLPKSRFPSDASCCKNLLMPRA
jgi:hypothetical protein